VTNSLNCVEFREEGFHIEKTVLPWVAWTNLLLGDSYPA
jgi:hypothetical protein